MDGKTSPATGRPKVDYTAYIGEIAVRTAFGGKAFIDQLKRLVEASQRGIGVRIVPALLPHAALAQSWMLLEFPDSPPIAFTELIRSAVFVHDAETAPYIEHRAKLNKIALSTAESRDMLKKLIKQREGEP